MAHAGSPFDRLPDDLLLAILELLPEQAAHPLGWRSDDYQDFTVWTRGPVECVCRRFRRIALSLPCRVKLSSFLRPSATAESVLRCLRGRTLGSLDVEAGWTVSDPSRSLLGQLTVQLLPSVTRLRIADGLPEALLGALPHAASLRQLEIELDEEAAGPDEVAQFPGLPFDALAGLPRLAALEELSIAIYEVEWDSLSEHEPVLAPRSHVLRGASGLRKLSLLLPACPTELAAALASLPHLCDVELWFTRTPTTGSWQPLAALGSRMRSLRISLCCPALMKLEEERQEGLLPGLQALSQLPQLALTLRTDASKPDDSQHLRGMQTLSALHVLDICPDQPTDSGACLPSIMWDCTWSHLTELTLDSVDMEGVDGRLPAARLPCLRRLEVSSPAAGTYPESLCSLGQLTYLKIDVPGDNPVPRLLPPGLTCLSQLHVLVLRAGAMLDECSLETLSALPCLDVLDLRECRVERFPAHLTRLRALSLPYEQPSSAEPLPPSIAQCTCLQVLCASIEAGPLEALASVWARLEAALRPLRSLQVLYLGLDKASSLCGRSDGDSLHRQQRLEWRAELQSLWAASGLPARLALDEHWDVDRWLASKGD